MDTPIIFILLYLLINKSTDRENTLHSLKGYLSNISIDSRYTTEKIKIAKRIGPLLPTEHGPTFNKSILMAEKIIRIKELIEFLDNAEVQEFSAIELEPKERLQRIIYTLQDEVNNSQIENLGTVLNLILNIDKYKKMLNAYNSLMNNKNPLSDTNSIISLMETFMEGSSEKDKEKIKEMSKMMDILKMLDTPNKEKPNEN